MTSYSQVVPNPCHFPSSVEHKMRNCVHLTMCCQRFSRFGFRRLAINHTIHMDYFYGTFCHFWVHYTQMVIKILKSWPPLVTVQFCFKQHDHSAKVLLLCSTKDTKSTTFGITRGNDTIVTQNSDCDLHLFSLSASCTESSQIRTHLKKFGWLSITMRWTHLRSWCTRKTVSITHIQTRTRTNRSTHNWAVRTRSRDTAILVDKFVMLIY